MKIMEMPHLPQRCRGGDSGMTIETRDPQDFLKNPKRLNPQGFGQSRSESFLHLISYSSSL